MPKSSGGGQPLIECPCLRGGVSQLISLTTHAMLSHRLPPILIKLAAACSGLSHSVGQVLLRPELQALQPQAILRIEGLRPDQKLVALTIDDAPSAETGRILNMLGDHDATATFFTNWRNKDSRRGRWRTWKTSE